MIKHLFWIIIAATCGVLVMLGLSLAGAWLTAQFSNNGVIVYEATAQPPSQPLRRLVNLPKSIPPKPPELTLAFVGDIMLARAVRSKVLEHGQGDYHWLFEGVGELKQADILFGNLEGALSDQGRNVGSIYSFRMDPAALPALVDAGFDVLSVANNHAGDWAKAAFDDTVKRLTEAGLVAVGGGANKGEAARVKIVERGGLKVGFLAFTDVGPKWLAATADQSGILLASDPEFKTIVAQAAEQVDVLVVSFHFGDEYQPKPNARQKFLAESAIDAGAKIVAGHHPHVSQPVERYHGGVIAYSLGNFVFDQYVRQDTMRGTVLYVKLLGTEIIDVTTKTATLNQNYQPQL